MKDKIEKLLILTWDLIRIYQKDINSHAAEIYLANQLLADAAFSAMRQGCGLQAYNAEDDIYTFEISGVSVVTYGYYIDPHFIKNPSIEKHTLIKENLEIYRKKQLGEEERQTIPIVPEAVIREKEEDPTVKTPKETITWIGMKEYLPYGDKENQTDGRREEELLYDEYIKINSSGQKGFIRIFPIEVKDNGRCRCAVISKNFDSAYKPYFLDIDSGSIDIKLNQNVYKVVGHFENGQFSSTLTNIREEEELLTQKVCHRPKEERMGVGHIVFHPDSQSFVHLLPVSDFSEQADRTKIPCFGVSIVSYGDNGTVYGVVSGLDARAKAGTAKGNVVLLSYKDEGVWKIMRGKK